MTLEAPVGLSLGRVRFHWRRLLQFRLRTLLILTTLAAIGLGWWSHTARRQQRAVAALRQSGGRVQYYFEMYQIGNCPTSENLIWPMWLVDAVGVDYFACVAMVTMPPSMVNDDLRHLADLPQLEWVDLDNTKVTDAGLKLVACATSLESVSLNGTQISDAGLKHLEPLARLRCLYLNKTTVGDQSLAILANHKSMFWLTLNGTRVTDAGLKHLRELPDLAILEVTDLKVTAQGAEKLQKSHPGISIIGRSFFDSALNPANSDD
ncbi:MAG: hypothetical protein K8T91_06205 [Planctomycetes bacterium]|nr:hypothetical protein [Planctomycetota bacterium]